MDGDPTTSDVRSAVRVKQGGTYRIVTSVLPLAIYPSEIVEATARLFAFLENLRPQKTSGDMSDGTIATQAGAIQKSGAGELLRFTIRTSVDLRWPGHAVRRSMARRPGSVYGSRRYRRPTGAARGALATATKRTIKSHSTLAVLSCPT